MSAVPVASIPVTESKVTDPGEASTFSAKSASIAVSDDEESTDDSLEKKRRTSCNFMENRDNYRIIVDDEDVTPENITNPDLVTMEDTFTHAAFENKQNLMKDLKSKSIIMASRSKKSGMAVYATTINIDDIHIDHQVLTNEGYAVKDFDLDRAPSAYYMPKRLHLNTYPQTFFVPLKETETEYLFSIPCISFEKGTPAGNAVEEDNEYYNYITVGKGRNRKMTNEETQTIQKVTQSRHTTAGRPIKKNASTFAAIWDMHDTYAQMEQKEEEEVVDEMVMCQSAHPHLLRKKRVKTVKVKKTGLTFEEVGKTPQFFDAALLATRVMASRVYSLAQKKFRGLVSTDPLSLDLVYVYTMQDLWAFECPETQGRPVLSLAFNPRNPDIVAVAHGKFAYAEKFDGILCIWCTKNPCTPERMYRFPHPLTSVGFSDLHPNWLACGFANGDLCILDITTYTITKIAQSKRDTNPCFEPIWVTKWCTSESGEYVMTASQDGRINRFVSTKTHDFICTRMMRISTVEGKMKGLEATKVCTLVDVPITRYPAALCIQWHPKVTHEYLVGTDEGCIHKCSTHYLNQHIDVFKAHTGPVYGMEYSPFMSTLLVSCGADNAIRLWLDGMDDVIMTLTCPAAVYGVAFCPINATILLSVSGNIMSVWDLRRKTHCPCADFTFPGSVVLTFIKCSESGDNVFVGDSIGRVHTFHLEDTPIPPYYQRKMLDDALKKALCTRPHLLRQMEKLEKLREKFK